MKVWKELYTSKLIKDEVTYFKKRSCDLQEVELKPKGGKGGRERERKN